MQLRIEWPRVKDPNRASDFYETQHFRAGLSHNFKTLAGLK